MKKLPLVVALGAASLCTLSVAQSSVTVYGRLYPYLEQESGSGPSPAGTPVSTLSAAATGVKSVESVKGMSAGNSNIGVRGTEDLGGGLKANFQVEGVVDVDTGSAGGFRWNRNGFVGLEGAFGEVRLGIMDTVFKDYGDTLGILGTSSGTPMSSSNILRKPGIGSSNNARFHERRANSIRYDSPEVGGIQGALQVATNEGPIVANGSNAKTFSFGVKYDSGPWYFAIAHEIHDNYFGGSSHSPAAMRNTGTEGGSKDKATQFTVEWRPVKAHKFEFDVIRKSYDETASTTGRFKSYDNTAYMIAVDSRWSSQWRTAAHYVRSNAGTCQRVNAVCSTEGLAGSQITAGASYYTSRRTFFFGIVTKMVNGNSSRFAANDFAGTPSAGEDITHLILGISHAF